MMATNCTDCRNHHFGEKKNNMRAKTNDRRNRLSHHGKSSVCRGGAGGFACLARLRALFHNFDLASTALFSFNRKVMMAPASDGGGTADK
jgi:hypothetical protein